MRAPAVRSFAVKPFRGGRSGPQVKLARAPVTWGQLLALLLLGVLTVYLLIAAASPGDGRQIIAEKSWGRAVAQRSGPGMLRVPADEPPLRLLILGAAGWTYRLLADPTFGEEAALASQLYTFLLKLPHVLAHLMVAVTVYRTTRRLGPAAAFGAAAAYALNPAVAYEVAHLGGHGTLVAALALMALSALLSGRAGLAGACTGLLVLAEPRAWVLAPIVGLGAATWLGRWRFVAAVAGGVGAGGAVLLIWARVDPRHALSRFGEYAAAIGSGSGVMTAEVHNLWWVPTLVEWRYLGDWESLLGPLSYRAVALGMTSILLAVALARVPRLRPRDQLYGLVATVLVGVCALMPGSEVVLLVAALPLMAVAWALDRRAGLLFGLVSAALLLNLGLHDPLLMGPYAAGPDPRRPLPGWVIGAQIANVLLLLAALGLALVETFGGRLLAARSAR